MARAPILHHRRTTTGAEDLLKLKKFCVTPQKRLDFSRFCTHTGAGSIWEIVVALLLAPPRRPGFVKPQATPFLRIQNIAEPSNQREPTGRFVIVTNRVPVASGSQYALF